MEFDWHPGVDVPDKRLEALGVRVGTIAEFARTVLKSAPKGVTGELFKV